MGMDFGQSIEDKVVELLQSGQYSEAINYASTRAQAGNAEAMYVLGQMYYHGAGVVEDKELAAIWYKRAADAGSAPAMFEYAVCCADGDCGVEQDISAAIRYYMEAARRGHAPAQFEMGMRYEFGEGITENIHEAVQLYSQAAKQGHAGAMYFLGHCYKSGRGVKADLGEAVNLFRQAAELGNTDAMVSAACILAAVDDDYAFEPDADMYNEAFSLLSRAVEAGNVDAHFYLGIMYNDGLGVARDQNQAYKFVKLAADNGQQNAQRLIKNYRRDIYGDWYYKG